MKKQSERKGFSRLGLPASGGSPGFTGMLIECVIHPKHKFFSVFMFVQVYKTSLSFCALLASPTQMFKKQKQY